MSTSTAEQYLRSGQPREARDTLWALLDRTHVSEVEQPQILHLLQQTYIALGRKRAAATVALYRGDASAVPSLSDDPRDRARARLLANDIAGAAQEYQQGGCLGHAAILLEKHGDHARARVLWAELAESPKLASEPYTQGLVRFNLGRACIATGDEAGGRKATIQAMHLLEAAADAFETQGLRERAFDCYQVLLNLGRGGAFENLAEGYLNCIRILKEDNLSYYVLQYYEDFQELALKAGELHAAATLFREAAEFSRAQGMPYGALYEEKAAQTLMAAAARTLEQGGAPEMAENAYAAAIDLFNDIGAYSQVCAVYGELAKLPLGEKRKARYSRLQERLREGRDEAIERVSFPDYLRVDTAYLDIWHLDVLEWEQGGDAAETMGEVLLDPNWSEYIRRRALLARLQQLGADELANGSHLVGLAAQLAKVGVYVALSPLEHLAQDTRIGVRQACMRAVRQLQFKRSFVLVMQGLADDAESVKSEALAAVASLHFKHAFDPLQRIYRESRDAKVRKVALGSISRIPSQQALEALIDVLRQGTADEKKDVSSLLISSTAKELDGLLAQAAINESDEVQAAIRAVQAGRRR